MTFPELSIIVPLLNESQTLCRLFETLSTQTDITFEVIAVDGGSDDDTCATFAALALQSSFPSRMVRSERGRSRQLNTGAKVCQGQYLLFLHADSRFDRADALSRAVEALRMAIATQGGDRVAGRFALRFDLQHSPYSMGYYFYECKARLDRSGCIHGDQGFLLSRSFFEEVGLFDEALPLLEDDRLADAVRQKGEWILFPDQIFTSARRFEVEGLWERQVLNALIMNFAAIGCEEFFRECGGVYRVQDRAGHLDLSGHFKRIWDMLRRIPLRNRFSLWCRTGRYVRSNAWQVLFFFKVRRRFSSSIPPDVDFFNEKEGRIFDLFTDNGVGRILTTFCVFVWFHLYALHLAIFRRKP